MKLTNCIYTYLLFKTNKLNKVKPETPDKLVNEEKKEILNYDKESTLRPPIKVYPIPPVSKEISINLNTNIENSYKEKIPKICGLRRKIKVICKIDINLNEELNNFEKELKSVKVPLKESEILSFVYFKDDKSKLKICILKKCNPDQTQHSLLSLNSKIFKHNNFEFTLFAAGEIHTKIKLPQCNSPIKSEQTFTISPKTGSFYSGESKINNLNQNVKALANQNKLDFLDYQG